MYQTDIHITDHYGCSKRVQHGGNFSVLLPSEEQNTKANANWLELLLANLFDSLDKSNSMRIQELNVSV